MENNKTSEKKPLKVTPKYDDVLKPDLFLMRVETENGVEIHLANKREDSNEIEVTVSAIIEIKKELLLEFAIDYLDALKKYEREYKNGFGFEASEDAEDNSNE